MIGVRAYDTDSNSSDNSNNNSNSNSIPHMCMYIYIYIYIHRNSNSIPHIVYDEFARLAETRLAQNTLNCINIAKLTLTQVSP